MAAILQRVLRAGCSSNKGVLFRNSTLVPPGATIPFLSLMRSPSLSLLHTNGTGSRGGDDDEEDRLHPTWGQLERRLRGRVPRERAEGVPEGRRNMKPSEEDFWHEAGVYDHSSALARPSSTIAPGEPACARMSTIKVASENLSLVVALYKKSIAPALQVKGFCGAQVFSDRAEGTVRSLTLWESWGDLETAVADPSYAKAMRSLSELIEAPPEITDADVACSILPTTGGGEPGNLP